MKKNPLCLISFLPIILSLSSCSVVADNDKSYISEVLDSPPSNTVDLSNNNSNKDNTIISYDGDHIVSDEDFAIFEKYFLGHWIDKSQKAPQDLYFDYYSPNMFLFEYNQLLDIYTNEEYAFLVITQSGEVSIFVVAKNAPSIMFQYDETNHNNKIWGNYDFSYEKKESIKPDDHLSFFGVIKLEVKHNIPCDLIEETTFIDEKGRKWYNYANDIRLISESDKKIVLKAKCYSDQCDFEDSNNNLDFVYVEYNILKNNKIWVLGDYKFLID